MAEKNNKVEVHRITCHVTGFVQVACKMSSPVEGKTDLVMGFETNPRPLGKRTYPYVTVEICIDHGRDHGYSTHVLGDSTSLLSFLSSRCGAAAVTTRHDSRVQVPAFSRSGVACLLARDQR
ncbi:hypothetical protein J6590_002610 [Homalodisca vitripennis]|nr:hypothetical protein J6590_002610 [Homalodisca vitripennis]